MPTSPHRRRELRAHVADELRSLGASEDDVAHALEAAGVRGLPRKVADCALAVYLSAVVAADPRVRAVYVSPVRVFVKVDDKWCWPWVGVPLTKPLRGFVERFDRRAYPALVRPLGDARSATGRHGAMAPNAVPQAPQ